MKSPSAVKTKGTRTFLYLAIFSFSTGIPASIYAPKHSNPVIRMKTIAAVSISALPYEKNSGIYIPTLSAPPDTVTAITFKREIFPSFPSASSSFLHSHAFTPRTSGTKPRIQT